MLLEYLTNLYNILKDVETKGENTLKMAQGMNYLAQIINAVQASESPAAEPVESEE